MKKSLLVLGVVATFTFASCGGASSEAPAQPEMEQQLEETMEPAEEETTEEAEADSTAQDGAGMEETETVG
jgi:hypothetical protein